MEKWQEHFHSVRVQQGMEKTEKLQVWVLRTARQRGERPSGRLCRREGPQKGGVGWVCLRRVGGAAGRCGDCGSRQEFGLHSPQLGLDTSQSLISAAGQIRRQLGCGRKQ